MSGETTAPAAPIQEELGYLNIRDFGSPPPDLNFPRAEGFKDKFIRKTKENPFVPIGLAVTTFALTYGIYQMKTGDRLMSQKMMRLRVAAQGFTVFALIAGVAYSGFKAKKPET